MRSLESFFASHIPNRSFFSIITSLFFKLPPFLSSEIIYVWSQMKKIADKRWKNLKKHHSTLHHCILIERAVKLAIILLHDISRDSEKSITEYQLASLFSFKRILYIGLCATHSLLSQDQINENLIRKLIWLWIFLTNLNKLIEKWIYLWVFLAVCIRNLSRCDGMFYETIFCPIHTYLGIT